MPRLINFKAHYKHKIINTNTTITQPIITPQKPNKWHIRPTCGIGYGIINKKTDLYIGFGISIDI